MTATFIDSGQSLDDFADIIYVRCPRCQRRAQVKRLPINEEASETDDVGNRRTWRLSSEFHPRKLSCLHCGYSTVWQKNTMCKGGPHDWFFHLPLWLQTPCCGETLWALNEEHLRYLENYVAAKHRVKFPAGGLIRNRTLASRLPDWLKSAKNREEVLKGLARLRALQAKV